MSCRSVLNGTCALGLNLRRSKGNTKDYSSSSDTDAHYKRVALSATGAVVHMDDALSKDDGRGGSRPGRAPNSEFERLVAEQSIRLDFFRCAVGAPIFSENEFELGFHLLCDLYKAIRRKVGAQNPFLEQRNDATGKTGASKDRKLYAALLMLGEGRSARSLALQLRISEPSCMECTKEFTNSIVETYREESLKYRTIAELDVIEQKYALLGFPVFIEAADCAGWAWSNCLVAWQGNFKGKEKVPTIRMVLMYDDILIIWHHVRVPWFL